jgi:hypothetical protein
MNPNGPLEGGPLKKCHPLRQCLPKPCLYEDPEKNIGDDKKK